MFSTYGPAADFALAAMASALLTAAWIRLAHRGGVLDHPGARRVHRQATPRGGGIGIALVFTTWVAFTSGVPTLAAGLGLFAAVGLLDDVRPLGAALKLVLQLAAAALLCVHAVGGIWPLWLAAILATAFLVNAFNFMDGSNGLVAMQGLVIGIAIAAWPGQLHGHSLAGWVLAGCCLGFVPFNLPRARTFLGDVGSHAIGAAVACLLLLSWWAGTMPAAAVVLLLTPVLVDTVLTLGRRMVAGKRIWHAHREHLYQYAVRSGHSHLAVCLAYAAWTAACAGLAYSGVIIRSSSVMWIFVILNWMLGTALYVGLRRHWLRTRRQGVAGG